MLTYLVNAAPTLLITSENTTKPSTSIHRHRDTQARDRADTFSSHLAERVPLIPWRSPFVRSADRLAIGRTSGMRLRASYSVRGFVLTGMRTMGNAPSCFVFLLPVVDGSLCNVELCWMRVEESLWGKLLDYRYSFFEQTWSLMVFEIDKVYKTIFIWIYKKSRLQCVHHSWYTYIIVYLCTFT